MIEPSGLYYPNRIARYFYLAMEDVMGQNGLGVVLDLANLQQFVSTPPPDNMEKQFDFAYMAALSEALEEMYGARGGRGMALRIGRSAFAQGMKSFGALRGVSDAAFRALPLEERTDLGLRALADIYTNFSDQASTVETEATNYRFIVTPSPMAWGRVADKPVCHALVGILQECLRWVSNGYEYYVHETDCQAAGGEACVFSVNKTPIGQR